MTLKIGYKLKAVKKAPGFGSRGFFQPLLIILEQKQYDLSYLIINLYHTFLLKAINFIFFFAQ
jgi:hypothetical protein